MLQALMKPLLAALGSPPGARLSWKGAPGAAVIAIGADGRIEDLSDGAPQALGLSRGELRGARFLELFAPADRPRLARALSLGAAAGRIDAQLLQADRTLTILITQDPRGGASALLIEGRAQAHLATLQAQAERARADAAAAAERLADLSHEMRTPLNAVIGFSEAIAAETYGPLGHEKYGEYAAIIRASGGHLLDLVTAILDLAKIEAGRLPLRREKIDAGALARECAAIVRLQAEKAGLKLAVEIGSDLPEVYLDPRAVRQILLNLLANAVKFTSDGGVSLTVCAAGADIAFTVADTGVGMNADDLARLGARFTPARADGVRGANGAGLGLALARALSELHGGAMTLSSAPGEGLVARVVLPAGAPAAPVRRLKAVSRVTADERPQAAAPAPEVLTQLERIEAWRRQRALSAA